MSFYVKDIEYILDDAVVTLWYNTTDGVGDEIRFKDEALLDVMVFTVLDVGPELVVDAHLVDNPLAHKGVPSGGRAFMIGGGLGKRRVFNYSFSLDSPLSEKVRVDVSSGSESATVELSEGDLAYFGELEFKALDIRLDGSYVLLYARNDSQQFRELLGMRYCAREGVSVYSGGEPFVVDARNNVSFDGRIFTLKERGSSYADIIVWEDSVKRTHRLYCGSVLNMPGRRYSLLWAGAESDGSAKLVSYAS